MDVPKFEDFTLPLLRALGDGGEHELAGLRARICDGLGLSEEQRTAVMPRKRVTYVQFRMGWAATYLRMAGLLSRPGRGIVRITARGKKVLQSPPPRIDRKYLRGIPEFVANVRRADPGKDARDEGSETPDDVMRQGFEDVRSALYGELKEAVMQVSPGGFEHLVLELFNRMGYGDWVEHTGRSGDGGIDGIIRKDRLGLGEIRVQAKRWSGPVSAGPVREFMGVLHGKDGIFITTSTFAPNAEKEATSNVALIDGEKLVELMWEYGVGVSDVETLKIKALDSEYFDQFK